MKNFVYIEEKLQGFIRKYYSNQIIKGSILFLSFGLLYLILTLFIEYFLWLQPLARTLLFWVFIMVELGLLTNFILIPLLRLFGLRRRISSEMASRIIGKHFKDVDDKLLNVLQLRNTNESSDLVIASIEQKSRDLSPIPFKKAIDLKSNRKYLRYLLIPVIIWLLVFISGNISVFTNSLDRVVHHQMAYAPPAPFSYKILNEKLESIEGESYKLLVSTIGNVIPEDIKINFNGESYFLKPHGDGSFIYEFSYLENSIDFILESQNVTSIPYTIDVINAPKIIDFEMLLQYPEYVNKEDQVIKNTGNAVIPEGTNITWNISSKNTSILTFVSNDRQRSLFESSEEDSYEISKDITNSVSYQIATSNQNLNDYEKLNYFLKVIKDQHPKIAVKSDIETVLRGSVQFIGQLSDDYGISKLQLIARNVDTNKNSVVNIEIGASDFEEFFYRFPQGLVLDEGANYEIYFEVFDNDAIHGRKKTKSKAFYYKVKTDKEIEEELLKEQKESLDEMQNAKDNAKEIQKSLDALSDKLKSKNNSNWNDKKQLNEYLDRQKNYQEFLEKNSNKMLENLNEMDEEGNEELKQRKEELKRRIEEAKELQEKKNLLKELEELADKLKKEELLDKIDKLKEQSKQENRSLERILELTKRFYVEKKSAQIMRKIENLSKNQEELAKSEVNNSKDQDSLNQKFDSIQKELKELKKQNEDLKQPMDLHDSQKEEKEIDDDMEKAEDALSESERGQNKQNNQEKEKQKNASKHQKSAAKKMKELSQKMKAKMTQMQMQGNEENMNDLQQVLDNLLIFSFDQEQLMESLENVDSKNADYPEKLRKQQILKEYFEHIDDSLYTLSLRLVRLSSKIQEDLADAHYNLDKSLENLAENRMQEGISNQLFTMTAANNLADLLSDMLQSMKNNKPGNGSGQGSKKESVSLPDIIKKQGELMKKLGSEKGVGKKNDKQSKEQMSGEQYEIYKQQNQLKEELRGLLNKSSQNGKKGNEAINKMEELEDMLLKAGYSKQVLEKMRSLMKELLELDDASFEKDREQKREGKTNLIDYNGFSDEWLDTGSLNFKQNEILLRNELPLQPVYKKKVKTYFENKE